MGVTFMHKESASYRFVIKLLGSFYLELENQKVTMDSWKSKKALMLFKYLAAKHEERIPSDVLIDLLWPDSDFESAIHNLHTTVYFLRKTLQQYAAPDIDISNYIRFANGLYWLELDENCYLDTAAYSMLCQSSENLQDTDSEKALQAGMEALALYRGNFLQEDPYVDWAANTREYYREQFIELSLRTSQLFVTQKGDYKTALKICRVALTYDPYLEELHQSTISYLICIGRIPEAAAQYKTCAKMLKDEFGLEPCEETQGLLGKIRNYSAVNDIADEINLKPKEGTYLCERAAFKSILQLEQRRLERNEKSATLVTIAIIDREKDISKIINILKKCLRKDDVATQWSRSLFAVLLTNTDEPGYHVVLNRLKHYFATSNMKVGDIEHYVLAHQKFETCPTIAALT